MARLNEDAVMNEIYDYSTGKASVLSLRNESVFHNCPTVSCLQSIVNCYMVMKLTVVPYIEAKTMNSGKLVKDKTGIWHVEKIEPKKNENCSSCGKVLVEEDRCDWKGYVYCYSCRLMTSNSKT
jgi:hypothetical protein